MTAVISEALRELADIAATRTPDAPRVIGIDGPAGSGKTTIASHLAAMLGGDDACVVVHMDDIYPGWDGLAAAPSLLEEHVLAPLRSGARGRFRRWNWERGLRAGEIVVPRRDWVLVEGVASGSRNCRPYLSALLFMYADEEVRMRRGIERDGESFRPHWQRWARQEEALFAAEETREHADVIIRT